MARTAIHPGEHLAEELHELGISEAEAAWHLELPVTCVTELISGRRRITSDIAARLALWFGTSAQFWMNLQTIYDARVTRRAPSAGR
jgi:antitoxin HigA-1